MKNIILAAILAVTFASCTKAILGAEEENDPVNNFELFWNDYNDHSGIIFPKNINWDSVYQVYQPQVTEMTTEDELWTIFTEMIEVFDDEHTFIEKSGTEEFYVSGGGEIDAAIAAFSKEVIDDNYLDYRTVIETAPDLSYGKIKDKDIGYIYVGDTDGNHPEKTMDAILAEIGEHKAIIFDVRNNGGGSGEFALGITKAFAEETKDIMSHQTRNGKVYNDYDEKTWVGNVNDGENQYTEKPVIVLTDKFSVSGAEHITIYLKSNSHITHLGNTTAGAFSSTGMHRFLPNGWLYQYPAQTTLRPNGESLDGTGLVPDVFSINTADNIAIGKDIVLEDAFAYLLETYDIE